MIRKRSSARTTTWRVVLGCVGLFIAEPMSHVSAQEVFFDLTRALQNAADRSARRHELRPSRPTEAAPGTDFVLSGVVIAENTRLALLQEASGSAGDPQLLPVGGELAGYRLTDIQVDQVTLEGRGGDRMVVRLQAGGGAGQTGPATSAARIDGTNPSGDGGEPVQPSTIEEKEARQTWRAEQAARDRIKYMKDK